MNSFYTEAGRRIRRLRELNGYTREALAELADISSKFLYEIETGHKGFSADTLYRIGQALSVSCEFILSGNTQDNYNEEIASIMNLFDNSQIKKVSEMFRLIHEINCASVKSYIQGVK